MADYWDDSAGWVHCLAFSPQGVRAFELEIDRPFVGSDEFIICLSGGKHMHIFRKSAKVA